MIALLRKYNINILEIIVAILIGFVFADDPHYINDR